MGDKTLQLDDFSTHIESGMTIGIGGWGSRRKPMALVRALLRSEVKDLTVVTFGGPDVGLLCAAGKIRKLIYGFVSLDSIPLDPHFSAARENASIEISEYDEGMFVTGLRAAASRMSFLPTRAGMGSDVLAMNPELKTIRSPYADETYVAMPALNLDVALVHVNRADNAGNSQFLGPDPYFDDLFVMAAEKSYVSAEKIVPTAELHAEGSHHTLLFSRMFVSGVIETPRGAHFTSCEPDYDRDEGFQKAYATAAKSPQDWLAFEEKYLRLDEAGYHCAVADLSAATHRKGA